MALGSSWSLNSVHLIIYCSGIQQTYVPSHLRSVKAPKLKLQPAHMKGDHENYYLNKNGPGRLQIYFLPKKSVIFACVKLSFCIPQFRKKRDKSVLGCNLWCAMKQFWGFLYKIDQKYPFWAAFSVKLVKIMIYWFCYFELVKALGNRDIFTNRVSNIIITITAFI